MVQQFSVNYFTLFLTFVAKVFEGLNDGILCEGIIIVVFLEIFLAVFSALFFTIKLLKPVRYTFLFLASDVLTVFINASTAFLTVTFSIPVFLEISLTIS